MNSVGSDRDFNVQVISYKTLSSLKRIQNEAFLAAIFFQYNTQQYVVDLVTN